MVDLGGICVGRGDHKRIPLAHRLGGVLVALEGRLTRLETRGLRSGSALAVVSGHQVFDLHVVDERRWVVLVVVIVLMVVVAGAGEHQRLEVEAVWLNL